MNSHYLFGFDLRQVFQDHEDKVEFSGPLLSQSHKIDELLKRHERQIRQAVRRTWFQRGDHLEYKKNEFIKKRN